MTTRIHGIALALVLCGAPLFAAESRNIDKTLALSPAGAVTLDAHNGSIQVRTWDRSEIEIHVRIEAGGTSADARRRFNETTVEIDGSPDRVSIRSKFPDIYSWSWWSWVGNWGDWDSSPAIHYTITAARAERSGHNAKAEIRDVNAALELNTHKGSVWVAKLGGPLELNMHNGDAHIDFASFTHESSVNTHNATVELALPASSKFEFHSRGHNVHVDSDFPATARSSDFGRHDVNGRVNGGGPELRLNSHNGDFRLRSK